MRTIVMLAAVVLCALSAPAQNLFATSRRNPNLIADLRAGAVGDILTVTISESHSVKNESKTERTNDTTLAARLEAFTIKDNTFQNGVLPKFDVRKESEFNGESKVNQGSEVRASVAVIVIDVQPNGNLVIAGSRQVVVDDETRTLRISGIVRPLDITSNNTVTSFQVADARVSIINEGGGQRVTTRGPIGTFFDTLIWAAWPF